MELQFDAGVILHAFHEHVLSLDLTNLVEFMRFLENLLWFPLLRPTFSQHLSLVLKLHSLEHVGSRRSLDYFATICLGC